MRVFKRNFCFVFCFVFCFSLLKGQVVNQHIINVNIYEFLDELANEKIIELNSAVKPYSRSLIANKLHEAKQKTEGLNRRQIKELNFYLKDYIKEVSVYNSVIKKDFFSFKDTAKRFDAFFYKDSLFTLSINPLFGYNLISNKSQTVNHRYSGADMFGYIGKNIGFYASLRDNNESTMLSNPLFLNQNIGPEYKKDGKGGGDYSEMRGGITYSNKWASIGFIKDHFVWGNNYNGSNIFSGRTPSFAQFFLKLNPVKWLEFNYVHGYLVSGIVDSASSYIVNKVYRNVYYEKLLSTNFITFKPVKNLFVSFGNSVIYSNMGKNPVYMMPLFFYKSLDHTYSPQSNNGGQNAQMFFDISSRNIRHVHLYSSFYIDEISFSRIWDRNKQSNFISGKLGIRTNNLFIKNLFFTAEFTRTNPIVYKHYIATTTFESNGYNLGHYLKDNSKEFYFSLSYKPISRMHLNFSHTEAFAGLNYPDIRRPNLVWGLPFIDGIKWRNSASEIKINYEIINDLTIKSSIIHSYIRGDYAYLYTPDFQIGNQIIYTFGINFGF